MPRRQTVRTTYPALAAMAPGATAAVSRSRHEPQRGHEGEQPHGDGDRQRGHEGGDGRHPQPQPDGRQQPQRRSGVGVEGDVARSRAANLRQMRRVFVVVCRRSVGGVGGFAYLRQLRGVFVVRCRRFVGAGDRVSG